MFSSSTAINCCPCLEKLTLSFSDDDLNKALAAWTSLDFATDVRPTLISDESRRVVWLCNLYGLQTHIVQSCRTGTKAISISMLAFLGPATALKVPRQHQ